MNSFLLLSCSISSLAIGLNLLVHVKLFHKSLRFPIIMFVFCEVECFTVHLSHIFSHKVTLNELF